MHGEKNFNYIIDRKMIKKTELKAPKKSLYISNFAF